MLNFYQWCKTPSSAFSKQISATTPNFLHVFGRAPSDVQLCFVQLKTLAPSARYSIFKYPVTLKHGLGVTQGHWKLYQWIRNPRLPINVPWSPSSYLAPFPRYRPFPLKIVNFSHSRVYIAHDEGFPLEFGIGARGPECFYDGAGLSDGRKSFKIGLVILIQYRLWQTTSQPPSHVAVAITLNAKASSLAGCSNWPHN